MKGSFEFAFKNGVGILTAPNLKGVPHVFTTRHGGVSQGIYASLNLTFSGDRREHVLENYRRVLALFNEDLDRLITTKQFHGDNVVEVSSKDAGLPDDTLPHNAGGDALITNDRGIVLGGFGADCVVALFYDPTARCCGVAHAGWRGTALHILQKTVSAMTRAFGSRPRDILAALGPSIGKCCFETDADVPDALCAAADFDLSPYVERRGHKFHVDLPGINARMLENAGLQARNILLSDICTCCESDDFWSHRKTRGLRGVQGAFIMLS